MSLSNTDNNQVEAVKVTAAEQSPVEGGRDFFSHAMQKKDSTVSLSENDANSPKQHNAD